MLLSLLEAHVHPSSQTRADGHTHLSPPPPALTSRDPSRPSAGSLRRGPTASWLFKQNYLPASSDGTSDPRVTEVNLQSTGTPRLSLPSWFRASCPWAPGAHGHHALSRKCPGTRSERLAEASPGRGAGGVPGARRAACSSSGTRSRGPEASVRPPGRAGRVQCAARSLRRVVVRLCRGCGGPHLHHLP